MHLPLTPGWIEPTPQHPLNQGQQLAIQRMDQHIHDGHRTLILNGAAGTGKTWLAGHHMVQRYHRNGWRILLLAPTGRAASHASRVSGWPALTIHSALYHEVATDQDGRPIFLAPDTVCPEGYFVFIDEASMIHPSTWADLVLHMPNNSILCVAGDRNQLPPVQRDNQEILWGPDFDHPTATLTEVMRQAMESQIIQIATSVLEDRPIPTNALGREVVSYQDTVSGVARRVVDSLRSKHDHICITYTNHLRKRINLECRYILGHKQPLVVGDQILIRANNKHVGVYNGETYQIASVEPAPYRDLTQLMRVRLVGHHSPILVDLNTLGMNQSEFARYRINHKALYQLTCIDYGYCLTVHAAQGQEFSQVNYVTDQLTRSLRQTNYALWKRLTYTAMTRAKHHLVISKI